MRALPHASSPDERVDVRVDCPPADPVDPARRDAADELAAGAPAEPPPAVVDEPPEPAPAEPPDEPDPPEPPVEPPPPDDPPGDCTPPPLPLGMVGTGGGVMVGTEVGTTLGTGRRGVGMGSGGTVGIGGGCTVGIEGACTVGTAGSCAAAGAATAVTATPHKIRARMRTSLSSDVMPAS